jgi:hypothetical protein
MFHWNQDKDDNIVNVTFGKGKTNQNPIHDLLKFIGALFKPNGNNHLCYIKLFPLKSTFPNCFIPCHFFLMSTNHTYNTNPKY